MATKPRTCYITTPIYYPSGNLHLGHLYSTTLAWTLRNYKQAQGYDVKFLTGSDEHGQKIAQSAAKLGLDPQTYVDQQSAKFVDLWARFGIDYDYFWRTTAPAHKQSVGQIFSQLVAQEFIYKGVYRGLYSVSDEEFITENQAIKIENAYYHPTSQHPLQVIEEESYFFRMDPFTQWLKTYISQHPQWIYPAKIVRELTRNFLDQPLENLSVTRISFDWGIKIQQDPQHVIYVWLDALFNYVTALGFNLTKSAPDFQKYWTNGDEIIHVVGKEITRFHCIYWPIFLQALGLRLPTAILAHGWLITPEGKMSKSKNNVINPLDLLATFEAEVIKYYLVAKISPKHDGVFSPELLQTTYNSELANTIGNLINRTFAMVKKNFHQPLKYTASSDPNDLALVESISTKSAEFQKHLDHFEFDLGFGQMLALAKDLNKYIDLTLPWTLTTNLIRLEVILNLLLNGIYALATMLKVVMPQKMAKLQQALGVSDLSFAQIPQWTKFDHIVIGALEPLFARR